jgi:large subunit ribosomal protein L18
MKPALLKLKQRQRRKQHVRHTVSGTSERPRLSVFRSHNNIYAQIIDDVAGKTLVAASSMDKGFSENTGGNKKAAQTVGTALAQKAAAAGITKVVFDRNGYPFHGRVKELAEAARKGGLKF